MMDADVIKSRRRDVVLADAVKRRRERVEQLAADLERDGEPDYLDWEWDGDDILIYVKGHRPIRAEFGVVVVYRVGRKWFNHFADALIAAEYPTRRHWWQFWRAPAPADAIGKAVG